MWTGDKELTENWRSVVGFEGIYEVSDLGNVRSYFKGTSFGGKGTLGSNPRLKVQSPDQDGYMRVMLYGKSFNKKSINVLVHKLVLEAFIGHCPIGREGSHKGGKPANNKLENLCWETHKENVFRKIEHGTLICGEGHYLYGKEMPEETKQKISENHKGATTTEETKQKIRDSVLKSWELATERRQQMSDRFTGRVFSEEHKRKISEAKRKK